MDLTAFSPAVPRGNGGGELIAVGEPLMTAGQRGRLYAPKVKPSWYGGCVIFFVTLVLSFLLLEVANGGITITHPITSFKAIFDYKDENELASDYWGHDLADADDKDGDRRLRGSFPIPAFDLREDAHDWRASIWADSLNHIVPGPRNLSLGVTEVASGNKEPGGNVNLQLGVHCITYQPGGKLCVARSFPEDGVPAPRLHTYMPHGGCTQEQIYHQFSFEQVLRVQWPTSGTVVLGTDDSERTLGNCRSVLKVMPDVDRFGPMYEDTHKLRRLAVTEKCPSLSHVENACMQVGSSESNVCFYSGATSKFEGKGDHVFEPCFISTDSKCEVTKCHIGGAVLNSFRVKNKSGGSDCCSRVQVASSHSHGSGTKKEWPCTTCLEHIGQCPDGRYQTCINKSNGKHGQDYWDTVMLNTLWTSVLILYTILVCNNVVSNGMKSPSVMGAQKILEVVRGIVSIIGALMTVIVYVACFNRGWYMLKQSCEPIKEFAAKWYIVTGMAWIMQLAFSAANRIANLVNPPPGVASGGGGPMGSSAANDETYFLVIAMQNILAILSIYVLATWRKAEICQLNL
jgi:hypothetical protein